VAAVRGRAGVVADEEDLYGCTFTHMSRTAPDIARKQRN
jgi:hypothetical protein